MNAFCPSISLESGTINTTLAATPQVSVMTEKDAHSSNLENKGGDDDNTWLPTTEWVESWKSKLPLQTIMRLLQVLVPQVEQICIDKLVFLIAILYYC